MSKPGGFALLTVLWTLAAAGGLVAVTLAVLRVGDGATRNRIRLARGRWAAEACLAIAFARHAGGRLADTAAVELGRGTACAWRLDDPSARLNVNLVDREVLRRFLEGAGVPPESAAVLVEAVVVRRSASPFWSAEAVAEVPGFPVSVLPFLTADGLGQINASTAPEIVLLALPGMSREAVDALMRRRAEGRSLTSLDALAGQLSRAGRSSLLDGYRDLARLLVFAPPQLLLTAEGWVGSREAGPVSLIELLVVPLPERLAAIRRRMT